MATLTIRNLSEETRDLLRKLAAKHGHSMEEEARRILRRAVARSEASGAGLASKGLGSRIADIVRQSGGGELELPDRSPPRTPPFVEEEPGDDAP